MTRESGKRFKGKTELLARLATTTEKEKEASSARLKGGRRPSVEAVG